MVDRCNESRATSRLAALVSDTATATLGLARWDRVIVLSQKQAPCVQVAYTRCRRRCDAYVLLLDYWAAAVSAGHRSGFSSPAPVVPCSSVALGEQVRGGSGRVDPGREGAAAEIGTVCRPRHGASARQSRPTLQKAQKESHRSFGRTKRVRRHQGGWARASL